MSNIRTPESVTFTFPKLHDAFMEDVRHQIDYITYLKRKGNYKEAALAGLELAKAKVTYYEQFMDFDTPITGNQRINQDDYEAALRQLGVARDKCIDLGLWEK